MESINLTPIRIALFNAIRDQIPKASKADYNKVLDKLSAKEQFETTGDNVQWFRQMVKDMTLESHGEKFENIITTLEEPVPKFVTAIKNIVETITPSDTRFVMLKVGSNDLGFSEYLNTLGVLSFLYHNLRVAMKTEKITPLEWVRTLDVLYRSDLPNPGIVKFTLDYKGDADKANFALEGMEKARQVLVANSSVDVQDALAKLGLKSEIERFVPSEIKIKKNDLGRIMDEYARFMYLNDQKSFVKPVLTKTIISEFNIFPGMQSGYAPLAVTTEAEEKKLCQDINLALIKDLGDDPLLNRAFLISLEPAHFDITHMLPSEEMILTDNNPIIQQLLKQVGATPVMDPEKERESIKNNK